MNKTISLNDIDALKEVIASMSGSYIMPFFTDQKLGIWPTDQYDVEGINMNHLLEIRVFNEKEETRIWRNSITEDFKIRTIDGTDTRDTIYEKQFLDIDSRKTNSNKVDNGMITVVSTGGGTYKLPAELYDDNAMLILKNYIKYTEEGIAKIVDYRVVGIEKGGAND